MILSELSKLYYIRREVLEYERRLAVLRTRGESVSSPRYNGMPKNMSTESVVEKRAIKIIEAENVLLETLTRYYIERVKLERWIAAIPDSLTRQIFTARFVEGLTWAEVAEYIGGGITESGVRMICYRYLDGR